MSDAPLSRRARRTSEEEAADRAAAIDPTLAFARAIATGEVPALGPEGEALSRRDRRRLERLARPLEAWTAEEEMLATGQIPAMTPERIAEQERLSRQKAEAAAAEAEAASQEFRVLAAVEPRPAEPEADAPEPPTAPEQVFTPAEGVRPALEPYQPRVVLDEPFGAPAPAETVTAEPVVADVVQAEDARARVFDELFPPGSSQAALRQQDPFSSPAQPLPSDAIPVLDPPLPVTSPHDGVDEIRRLAAEAISGIERAARPGEPTAEPAPVVAEQASQSPWPSTVAPESSVESPVFGVQAVEAPVVGEAPGALPWNQVGPTATPAPVDDAPTTGATHQVTELAPHHAMFDQIARTPTGGLAVQQAAPAPGGPSAFPPVSGGFPAVASGPVPTVASGEVRQAAPMFPPVTTGSIPQQAAPAADPFPPAMQAPAWAAHPLEAVTPPVAPVNVNDFQPVSDVPRPDFSTFTQQAPASPFPSVGGLNTGDATVTGQISPIRRLDPTPVGGVKHFQWLHLAVIGALMFVLGVVIYHVAFGQ